MEAWRRSRWRSIGITSRRVHESCIWLRRIVLSSLVVIGITRVVLWIVATVLATMLSVLIVLLVMPILTSIVVIIIPIIVLYVTMALII